MVVDWLNSFYFEELILNRYVVVKQVLIFLLRFSLLRMTLLMDTRMFDPNGPALSDYALLIIFIEDFMTVALQNAQSEESEGKKPEKVHLLTTWQIILRF